LSLVRPAASVGRAEIEALSEEPDWWASAPLGPGGRDLGALPCVALDRLTEHYFPFALRAMRRYRAVLVASLGDAEDIPGQVGEWLLGAIRRYDPTRGIPFAGYVAASAPYWVSLAVRGSAGRYVEESARGYLRAAQRSVAAADRSPTLAEIATEFGEDMSAAAQRLQAIATYKAMRDPDDIDDLHPHANPSPVWPKGEDFDAADGRLLAVDERGQFTLALLMATCDDETEPNARGLWTLLLEQFGGYTRADLAAAGRCSKKGFVADQQRLLERARRRLVAS
jgi:hypothetical protein